MLLVNVAIRSRLPWSGAENSVHEWTDEGGEARTPCLYN